MPLDDNISPNASSGGPPIRFFSDGSVDWGASIVAYATGGSAGAWTLQQVDATHGLPVSVLGVVPVSLTALPASAATAANQATEISALSSIITLLASTLTVQVSALPTGLATSAKQDTGNTSLSSIDGKTPALGQALAAASVPVVLTAAQLTTLTPPTTMVVTGAFFQATQPVSAASLPLPTGAATSAKQDTGNTSVASIDSKTPALGQALAAGSSPVVLTAAQLTALTPPTTVAVTGAFFQATQPVSIASLPALAAGAAKIGVVTTDQTTHGTTDLVAADITKVGGSALALGQQLAGGSIPVVLTAAQVTALTPPTAVSAGGFTAVSTASKTRPANTTAYVAGQVVAESTTAATVWTFANCVRANGSTGSLLGVIITDTAKQTTTPQFNLWLFSAAPTVQNDAVAFAPSATDLGNLVAVVNLANFIGANANGILEATELNRPFKCAGGSTTLYGVLVAAFAYTPVSAEVFGITLLIGED